MARGGSPGDVVISMTLAETFLLLVFMLWFGVQPSKTEGPDPQLAALRAENEKLRGENQKLGNDLADVNQRLAWWQKRFDMPVPGSDQEWEKFKVEAGRGKPRCAEDNLLAQVSEVNGSATLKMLALPPDALIRVSGLNLKLGTALSTDREIALFLKAIQAYRRPPSQSECRFDYELLWATDRDYREAREDRFDRYLYPVKRRQVKP